MRLNCIMIITVCESIAIPSSCILHKKHDSSSSVIYVPRLILAAFTYVYTDNALLFYHSAITKINIGTYIFRAANMDGVIQCGVCCSSDNRRRLYTWIIENYISLK